MDTMIRTAIERTIVVPCYRVFTPFYTENSFETQWSSCYSEFQAYLMLNLHKKPFIVNVFVDAKCKEEFSNFEKQIKRSFSENEIPFAVVAQSPESPNRVIIEAGFVNQREVLLNYGENNETRFCQISNANYHEFWIAGVKSNQSAQSSFSKLHSITNNLGLNFNQIVRQWNTIEKIINFCSIDNKQRQNYQLFNEARNASYTKNRIVSGFPAATGIGGNWGGISINCLLIPESGKVTIASIGSPVQTDSYRYGQTVLKGDPDKNKITNQVPQFERAKLITDGKISRLFISGTASIIGQETIGVGDVEKQTRVTIDNIEMLTSKENLKSHFPALKCIPNNYAYIRAYVRYTEDIPKVKAICKAHFGDIPATYVKADICRDDLLVEIEGEKISNEPIN